MVPPIEVRRARLRPFTTPLSQGALCPAQRPRPCIVFFLVGEPGISIECVAVSLRHRGLFPRPRFPSYRFRFSVQKPLPSRFHATAAASSAAVAAAGTPVPGREPAERRSAQGNARPPRKCERVPALSLSVAVGGEEELVIFRKPDSRAKAKGDSLKMYRYCTLLCLCVEGDASC